MVVSTLLPPRTAQALQPLPRWTLTNAHSPSKLTGRGRALRHESMARAMETVATDTMLLIKVVRNRVEVGLLRQGLVESSIKNRDLW